jgi:hypothetical protein
MLEPRGVQLVMLAVEVVLRDGRRNGRAPSRDLRDLAAALAVAAPDVAARLPEVAKSWSAVSVEAGFGPGAPARGGWLSVPEAARVCGITDRGVRWACAEGRLHARRTPAGRWVIDSASAEDYGRRRGRAS